MNKRGFAAGMMVVAGVALAASCGRTEAPKALRMGTDAGFPPFEMRGGADGSEVVGFDVEVGRAIAAEAGLPLRIVDMDFDRLLPALAAGEVDLVLAALTITGERGAQVDFSAPYYRATQVGLILAGGAVPQSKEDLKGYKLGAQVGTTGDGAAAEAVGQENVSRFPTAEAAVAAVVAGEVECVLVDEEVALGFLRRNPDLMVARPGFDEEVYGVAVRKGDAALRGTVDRALAAMKGDGRHERWVERWWMSAAEAAE